MWQVTVIMNFELYLVCYVVVKSNNVRDILITELTEHRELYTRVLQSKEESKKYIMHLYPLRLDLHQKINGCASLKWFIS